MVDALESFAARAQARVGAIVNRKYRLDGMIGIGGMAAVYAATHRNSKRFAVKMLHQELSSDQDVRTRFLREGYVACQIEHRGAVAILDDDVAEDGSAFLVMELLEGLSVERIWEHAQGHVPVPVVMCVAYATLDVLVAAHQRGIVHRDIKPANLFVSREGETKVLDFGIARIRETQHAIAHATRMGTALGTPAFMAPEQALGKQPLIDAQSDVFAMGATMYSLLSGRLIHEAETLPELMVFAATRQTGPLASVAPSVPPGLAAIVDRALAFHKTYRWGSATEMREAIGSAYRAMYGESPSGPALARHLWGGATEAASASPFSSRTEPMNPLRPSPLDATGLPTPFARSPLDATGLPTPFARSPLDATGLPTPFAPSPLEATGLPTPFAQTSLAGQPGVAAVPASGGFRASSPSRPPSGPPPSFPRSAPLPAPMGATVTDIALQAAAVRRGAAPTAPWHPPVQVSTVKPLASSAPAAPPAASPLGIVLVALAVLSAAAILVVALVLAGGSGGSPVIATGGTTTAASALPAPPPHEDAGTTTSALAISALPLAPPAPTKAATAAPPATTITATKPPQTGPVPAAVDPCQSAAYRLAHPDLCP